jgi:hypothetical protein
LADTILAIRGELKRARDEGATDELRFGLGPVELEFAVEVSGETGVDGGLKVWVLSAGARRSNSMSQAHTIRLTLRPQGVDGKDIDIRGTVPSGKTVG